MFKQRRDRAHALLKSAGYAAGGVVEASPEPEARKLAPMPQRRELEPLPEKRLPAPEPQKRELSPEPQKRELRKDGGRVANRAGYAAGGAARVMKPKEEPDDDDDLPEPEIRKLNELPDREPLSSAKATEPAKSKAGGRIKKDDGGGVDSDLDAGDTGMKSGGAAHPGFKAVQGKIEGEGYSAKAAGAILARSTRGASKAAKKSNPRLNRVK